MLPARKTRGGTRYYAIADLLGLTSEDAPTVAYARVSSHDQKADLKRLWPHWKRTVRPKAGVSRSSATWARA